MLLDVCLGTRSSWKILIVLAEAPGKGVSRKEIQKLTKMGNKVIVKFLMLLENFGLVIAGKAGRSYYYKLNLANQFTGKILEMIGLEKKQLNNPDFFALSLLREFVYELTNMNLENMQHVILFGSYAKRTYNTGSDIDVALVFKERDNDNEVLIAEAIDRIKKRFGREIQPHYYLAGEFQELKKRDKLVQEIVKDGIMLM